MPKIVLCVTMIIMLLMSFVLKSNAYNAEINGEVIVWNPGIRGGIPTRPVVANVMDFGAKGDGLTDDSNAFIKAIESVKDGGAVLIPSGEYLLKSKITLNKPIVLRGEGPGRTNLLIDHSSDAFEAITYKRGNWVNLTGGYTRGSRELVVSDPTGFVAGKYVEIQQDNDPAVMYTLPTWNQGWADGAVGQIAKVVSVSGNTVTIDEPLRITYKSKLNPVIRTQGFAEYIGFEDFSVKRIDTSDTSMFYFKNAANCWISNVHSIKPSKAHVSVTTGYRIEVRDSFFDDATNWGGGGHGYGVELGFHSSDCLIENNIFKHLRHSMMVHLGANGNVFGYNYSIEPYQNEGGNWTPADISVHGHYAYSNLFEGNIVQEITVSDYWGPSGPYNTYFRNRVESENICVEDSSNYQNFIGNEIVSGNILWDTDDRYPHKIDPSTLFLHGNLISGSIQWNQQTQDHAIPDSYYLDKEPVFFGAMEWPSTGWDRISGTNPARERYYGNTIPTVSPTPDNPIRYGDINGDNKVNSTDLTLLKRYLMKTISDFPHPDGRISAEVSGDGKLNSTDLTLMKRYVLKIIDKFPVEEI
ncbi:glycosyl hydrolase family 28-related protein [Acetivibrio mesophilus]|uniref:Dockerin n=1 Tax=Acetivibrio mesophilus TaxID=2487273 RepID=A0A4Q0I6X5_9FIRM|nr:glycosyl hydrolase family 28-related protein [Acetivibrio mesophilus]ODM25546.1 dockerin [Clostridium sp. Bc-iso-3]RXE60131.1 dockerin [Acetivibrio mesophilus]